jgi:hypothetical protein
MKNILLGLVAATTASSAVAQGTAFTYQGRLQDGAAAANGLYELRSVLHNAVSGGSSTVAGPITNKLVSVSNGLFTVTLDFGSSAFDGNSRWLELGVRTNGSAGGFTALTPRQAVTPTPYAMLANKLNGTLPDSQLSANVPRLNADQIFSGNVSFSGLGNLGIGTALPVDAKLDLEGNLRLNDYDLFLRTGTDRNHGLGWYHTAKPFGGATPDGPVLYGFSGGILGTKNGGDRAALSWNTSQVTIPDPFALSFGNSTRQMLNLWGTAYGLGVQNNTLYQRSDGGFSWFQKGTHNNNANNAGTGGTNLMSLDGNGNLFANASVTIDSVAANNGSIYPGLVFGPSSGEGIASRRRPGANQYGLDFYTGFNARLSIANNGNVGINTTTPGGFLDINTGNGNLQVINDLVPTINVTGGGIPGTMRFRNTLEVFPSFDGTRVGKIDVRDTNGAPTITLSGTGVATVKVLEITGGADIAEPFQMSHADELPNGAVVVIDEENPGRLKMSSEPYDTRVAGIISGANGVQPGLALHQQGKIEGGQNVALTGRVYALADATHGAIKPGDLLTTSGTPGHVMRASDSDRRSGAVLGKAMTSLKDGKGMVLVLVSLQ